jgi:carboxyl-terminal processing protease
MGGGVDPDISVDKAPYAEILGSLVSKQLIFDYATQFVLDNDTIGAPGAYKIDDPFV